jgi:hypothetical protein
VNPLSALPLAFLASFALLLGCAAGPSRADIEAAMARAFAPPPPGGEAWPSIAAELKDAKLARVDRCRMIGASHVCPAAFELQSGQTVSREIWLIRIPDGWLAQSILAPEQ